MDKRIFQEKYTSYINNLKKVSNVFSIMYERNEGEVSIDTNTDILLEQTHSPVKGLIWKFSNRVLVMLTYKCLSNCRYCERQGRVGVGRDDENELTEHEIDEIISFLKKNKKIDEVIISGGDPLTHSNGLKYIAEKLSNLKQIRIIRIKTRVPLQDPEAVDLSLMTYISNLDKVCYLAVHVDHPDEFTQKSISVITELRKMGYILLGQTIFLKGINDDYDILFNLFSQMSQLGIRPYYIYHCQELPNTMKFVLKLDIERQLMTKLREELSGIAFPMHVIDMQNTTGKVIVPTHHWKVELDFVKNYSDQWYDLSINNIIKEQ